MRSMIAVASVALFAVLLVAAPVPKDKVKEEPATDQQRMEAQNNLKQILLAMHNYESAYGKFPGDIIDPTTKNPLLSWRVAILPYMESDPEVALYKEFRLTEPWDSEHNKKLIEKLPKIYAPVRAMKLEKGETLIRGFGGTNAATAGMFQNGGHQRLANFTDGLSNTIAIVDASESVVWTKPGTDLDPDAKEFPKLGRMIDGDFYCGMGDGSVRQVKREFDVKVMKAAVSRAGGEVLDEKGVFVK